MSEEKLIEQQEKEYASIILADRVEKKRKDREDALKEFMEGWKKGCTKDEIEEKISNALMMGRNETNLIEIPDIMSEFCNIKQYEWLRSEMEKYINENCQVKGIRVVFASGVGNTIYYDRLELVWANKPSCQCVCQ